MRPIELSEIKNIADYELIRPALRPRMIALKDRRRIRVGDHLTFLFEDRETVLYQIQEMMRIERIVKPEEVAHELATYNELIPADGELSATLLIEYESAEERTLWLEQLLGLEQHIWLEASGRRTLASLDTRQISPNRISSVQYLRFRLSAEQITAFPRESALIVDHPKYAVTHMLTPEERRELSDDLPK